MGDRNLFFKVNKTYPVFMRSTHFILTVIVVHALLVVPIKTSNSPRLLQTISKVPTNGSSCEKSFTQKPVAIMVIGEPIPENAQLPNTDILDGQSISFWLRIGPLNKPNTSIAALKIYDNSGYAETIVIKLDRITSALTFSLYDTKSEDPISTQSVSTKYNPRKWLLLGIKRTSHNELFPTAFDKIMPNSQN